MRIGIVCLSSRSETSELAGPRSPIPALAAALVEQGHEVALVTSGDSALALAGDRAELPGVWQVSTGPAAGLSETSVVAHLDELLAQVGRELAGGGYDVVHTHGWLAGLITASSNRSAPRGRWAPMVHTFHQLRLIDHRGVPPERRTADTRSRVERAVALRADHLIASCGLERDTLVAAGARRRRITVVPSGISIPDTPGIVEQRRRRHRLVVFGPTRHAGEVVHALAAVPETELVVCATPDDRIDGGSGPLTDLVARLGVRDRVRVEHRATPAERAPLIGSASLVLCLNSATRPGSTHLEAMALGIPVVAGNPLAAEAVIDGVTGVHVSPITAATLTAPLRGLLGNHVARRAMGIAGRDHVASRYSWGRIATETLRVYQAVPATSSAPAKCRSG